jgi:hypothetical protein
MKTRRTVLATVVLVSGVLMGAWQIPASQHHGATPGGARDRVTLKLQVATPGGVRDRLATRPFLA